MSNILAETEYARARNTFGSGLSAYTQQHCNISLTDNGYRIYRPANLYYPDSGSVMWGGLIIKPFDVSPNALIKGHSYCLMFDVEGYSSNPNEYYWSNEAGWVGAAYGLWTNAEMIASNMGLEGDFNGKRRLYYTFKVTDDIYKVCTQSYGGFTAGNSYNCYRDFKWGYNYNNTYSGTDIYIKNIRMYDITNLRQPLFLRNGVVDTGAVIEYGDLLPFELHNYNEARCNECWEV